MQTNETVRIPSEETLASDDGTAKKRRKLMLAAVIFGIAAALIITWWWGQKNGENQEGVAYQLQKLKDQYAPTFNKDGATRNSNTEVKQASPEELEKLAQAAKDAGLMIMGVTQCGWTRKQRELFGGRDSKARKIIESIYIECRSREMCPNVRGYPTWVHGDQQYPGYKDADNLRALIDQTNPLPAQPMLRMPSEPVDEANFDKFAVDPAPDAKDIKASDDIAQQLAANKGPTVEEIKEEEEEEEKTAEPKEEKARGVSDFPPLNVPDMPGTAPMALAANQGPSHPGDQMLQGNTARESVQNNDPVQELAQQMAQSFQQVAVDQQRDPANSLVTRARLPQSSTISTGDAFADKRIPVKKDK